MHLKPSFGIYIYLFLTVLFHPKLAIRELIFLLLAFFKSPFFLLWGIHFTTLVCSHVTDVTSAKVLANIDTEFIFCVCFYL